MLRLVRASWQRALKALRQHALLAIGMVCLASSLVFALGDQQRGAALIAQPIVLDLGTAGQGTVLHGQFLLRNVSSDVVSILGVRETCGCTVTTLVKKELSPGEETALNAQMTIGSRRGLVRAKLLVAYATSTSHDNALVVDVLCQVEPDVIVEPETLSFSAGDASRTVLLSPGRLKNVAVKDVSCTHRAFAARAVSDGAVQVTFDARAWTTDMPSVFLEIATNSHNEPICRIPLIVRVSP